MPPHPFLIANHTSKEIKGKIAAATTNMGGGKASGGRRGTTCLMGLQGGWRGGCMTCLRGLQGGWGGACLSEESVMPPHHHPNINTLSLALQAGLADRKGGQAGHAKFQ